MPANSTWDLIRGLKGYYMVHESKATHCDWVDQPYGFS